MTEDFRGKLVLVTGAATGIGRETALAFARAGARLWLCDVAEAALADTVERVRGAAGADAEVHASLVDVGRRDAVARFADEVSERSGALDVLVNNAGVGLAGGFLDTSLDDWDWLLAVNLWGVIHGCHYFVPRMVERGRGHVVNVASAAAFHNSPAMLAYGTSKYAVLGLSEALREELAPHGVGVSAICPGLVRTSMVETMRMRGQRFHPSMRARIVALYDKRDYGPDRVAAAILEAIADNRAVVPVNAEAWGLYLAKRAAPGLAKRLLSLSSRWMDR